MKTPASIKTPVILFPTLEEEIRDRRTGRPEAEVEEDEQRPKERAEETLEKPLSRGRQRTAWRTPVHYSATARLYTK